VEFSPSWVVTVLLALFIPVAAIMVILAYLLLGFLLPEDDT
jgi:phage shock protein PspC (stress-responsive transcriptional regulator)